MTTKGRAQEVLIARSKEGNEEARLKLAGLGVSCEAVETVKFEEPADWAPADEAVRGLQTYDWVAFTSPRAAEVFVQRLRKVGRKAKDVPKLAAVGSSTAGALSRAGLGVDYIPGEFLTEALGDGLPQDRGMNVLLFRADLEDKSLVSRLEKRGFEVTEVAAYRTTVPRGPIDPGAVEGVRVVVFASPSEVSGLRERLGEEGFKRVVSRSKSACIGPVTARAARAAGFADVAYPREHTLEALLLLVKEMTSDD